MSALGLFAAALGTFVLAAVALGIVFRNRDHELLDWDPERDRERALALDAEDAAQMLVLDYARRRQFDPCDDEPFDFDEDRFSD